MKRSFKVDEVKGATGEVMSGLATLRATLSDADQQALNEMVAISDKYASEISQDELAVVEAGVGAKPMSTHSSSYSYA